MLENAIAARAHEKAEAARIAARTGGGAVQRMDTESAAVVSTQSTVGVGHTRSKKAVVLKEEEKLTMLAIDTFSEASGIAWDSVFAITDLMEQDGFCGTIEDLCYWYKNLAPSNWMRVTAFWKYYSEFRQKQAQH